jgi:hypothetical protein
VLRHRPSREPQVSDRATSTVRITRLLDWQTAQINLPEVRKTQSGFHRE